MTDLSQNAPIRLYGPSVSEKLTLDTSVARHVYKGGPAIIDQDVDAANIVDFKDAVVVAVTDVFVGIFAEEAILAAGDPETKEVEVYVEPTIVGFKSAVFTMADLGKTVYMSDSGTLSTTSLANPQIGKLYLVRDGYAYVQLESPKICAGAGA